MEPQVIRYSERPELWDAISGLSGEVWPEYNRHGQTLNHYWGQLYDVFAEWQFVLYDPADAVILSEGHTIPVAWDGTDTGLGPGIDATITAAFELRAAGSQPTAVSALAAEIVPRHQGRRLSGVLLQAMSALARDAGLSHLIAPVRPSQKDRYPTIPIERYAHWARPDGSPFDPLGPRAHPDGRPDRAGDSPLAAHHRQRRRMGIVDADAISRNRGLRLPRWARHRAHRPRERHRRILGTQYLDHPPGQRRHSTLTTRSGAGPFSKRCGSYSRNAMDLRLFA